MTCTCQQRNFNTIALLLCICLYICISAWTIMYLSTWKRDTLCRVTVNHGVVNGPENVGTHLSGDLSSHEVEEGDISNPRTTTRSLLDKWRIIMSSSTAAATSPQTKTKMATFPPTLVRGKDITPLISKFFQLKAGETKDDFVNRHWYKFSLDSKRCRSGSTFLAIIVHSAPGNIQKRNLIRETFGSIGSYRNRNITVVFMLAAVKQQRAQDALQYESRRYDDIVQGNFPDSYKNLVRKHIMAMHWFKYSCKAKYILKLDDDTFVNPYRIIDHILRTEPQGLTIECKLLQGQDPIRNKRSKWHTPVSEYPFSVLPPLCIGFAYLTTPESWAAMYKVSETNRLMSMDDVYVSVVLAMKAGVQRRDFSNILVQCPRNKAFDYTEINQKAIVIDRGAHCGSIPFRHWRQIQYENEHW
ncbi:beta-1,3-galactosyltransferase 1-like [Haliotis rubra]|uniref:beta-1,3-galactosyltransferase 1-like n=1 Tax=Haliotis rubra TaxID=36100 RepID=UPI001EE61F1F|nr:beta-1,3-galactosyltransferase 1-like [Haliotis rubra]